MEEPAAAAAGRERAPTARVSTDEPGFRDAHLEPEPESISEPFESPFLGETRPSPPGSRVGPLAAESGSQDLETVGCFPCIQIQFSRRDDSSYF